MLVQAADINVHSAKKKKKIPTYGVDRMLKVKVTELEHFCVVETHTVNICSAPSS